MPIAVRIADLIVKYLDNEISFEEKADLDTWIETRPEHRQLFMELTNDELVRLQIEQLGNYDDESGWEKLQALVPELKGISLYPKQSWGTLAIAASVVILVSIFSYLFYTHASQKEVVSIVNSQPASILLYPGGNKATLTLADGKVIFLIDMKNGIVGKQGNTEIKLSNGELEYKKYETENQKSENLYNTLVTPKGGQYQLRLSDGTKIWLNAASSIKYPIIFTSTERKIEVTGEAYFEVAKDTGRPFRVQMNSATTGQSRGVVEVLGTHFNVMAYDDEVNSKITLLEGSVKVKSGSSHNQQFLSPGQQALIFSVSKGDVRNDGIKVIDNADMEQAVAWMRGITSFKDADIQTIMRQVARWYNVHEVCYEGVISDKHYSGDFGRQDNANAIIEMLEFAGNMRFRLEKGDENSLRIIVTQ